MEKIQFYKLADLSGSPSGSPDFEAPINPEQVSLNRQIAFEEDEQSGGGGRSEGSAPQYKSLMPDKLTINLVLDATGVIPGTENLDNVDEQLDKLNKLVHHYEGSKHRPNFVYVLWGTALGFRCMLESLKIDYTLFSPQGKTLRAKVAMGFVAMEDPEMQAKRVKKSSPDMTHAKLVRMGDRLPLMAYDIYGNFDYAIEVARANDLVNFRRLEPGTNLQFPPLEK